MDAATELATDVAIDDETAAAAAAAAADASDDEALLLMGELGLPSELVNGLPSELDVVNGVVLLDDELRWWLMWLCWFSCPCCCC